MTIINNRTTGQAVVQSNDNPATNRGNAITDFLRAVNQMIIFDPTIFDLTSGADVISQALQISGSLVDTSNPGIFRFFLNPQTLQDKRAKIINKELEKKGWELMHWPESSNEMIELDFAGTTGTLVPTRELRAQGIWDTKYSLNWLRFQQLQNLYLQQINDLKMVYDGKLYEGAIMNLSFTEDAFQPFFINYSFSFVAYPDRVKNIGAPNTLFNALPLANTIFSSGV